MKCLGIHLLLQGFRPACYYYNSMSILCGYSYQTSWEYIAYIIWNYLIALITSIKHTVTVLPIDWSIRLVNLMILIFCSLKIVIVFMFGSSTHQRCFFIVLILDFECLRFDKDQKKGGPRGYFLWLIIGYGVGEFFYMFLLKLCPFFCPMTGIVLAESDLGNSLALKMLSIFFWSLFNNWWTRGYWKLSYGSSYILARFTRFSVIDG